MEDKKIGLEELISQYEDGFTEINIPLSMEGIVDDEEPTLGLVKYDTDAFQEGVKEASQIVGFITALKNASCGEEMIMNILSMAHTKEMFSRQAVLEVKLAELQDSRIKAEQV